MTQARHWPEGSQRANTSSTMPLACGLWMRVWACDGSASVRLPSVKMTRSISIIAAILAHAGLIALIAFWPRELRPSDEPDFVVEDSSAFVQLPVDLTRFGSSRCEIHGIQMRGV